MLIFGAIVLAVVLIIIALLCLFFIGASWLDRDDDIEVFITIDEECKKNEQV